MATKVSSATINKLRANSKADNLALMRSGNASEEVKEALRRFYPGYARRGAEKAQSGRNKNQFDREAIGRRMRSGKGRDHLHEVMTSPRPNRRQSEPRGRPVAPGTVAGFTRGRAFADFQRPKPSSQKAPVQGPGFSKEDKEFIRRQAALKNNLRRR